MFLLALIAYALLFAQGCVAPDTSMGLTALAETVGALNQEVAGLKVEMVASVTGVEATAGGDVNEPVTGWIMAVALGMVALTYPVGKVLWLATGKGKSLVSQQIARRLPLSWYNKWVNSGPREGGGVGP
jgi:hypothetical protein